MTAEPDQPPPGADPTTITPTTLPMMSQTVRPRYGQASLADVLPGVLSALGVPGSADPLGLATDLGGGPATGPVGLSAGPASGQRAGVRAVVVLLLDGFGHHLIPLATPYAPTIAALADGRIAGAGARAITSGFPSTTPTSLATLGTGAAPGAHGLVGFFLNVPGTDQVVNHIHWDDEPDPRRWQPLDTQFDRARAAGVEAYAVSQPEFAGTGLTTAAFRGATYVGAAGVDALAEAILGRVSRAGRAVVYGYLADVDRAGHLHGLDSPQWRVAVAAADRLVTRLVDALPPDVALVVTADHGQLDIPAGRRFDIHTDARLGAGVRLVAGEPRVRYLHTVDGALDDVLATWRGVLGDAAWVVSRDEAVADGWFGPVAEAHLRRVGDVVAACREDYVVLASAVEPAQVGRNVAFHGSATAAEMMIPLLTYRRP